MHEEILTQEQKDLLPVLGSFRSRFGLVGGTAIALHIGHRRSIDFDMFSMEPFKNPHIKGKISRLVSIERELVNRLDEFTFTVRGVKVTFFHYPYIIEFDQSFRSVLKLPNLLTLAAMKAYALGQRAKWKDYVDLYFIMKDHHPLQEIVTKGKEIFSKEFNEKLFRTQLTYFKDVNYSEEVVYLPGFETVDDLIKEKLTEAGLS
jgi:hypothetical protein